MKLLSILFAIITIAGNGQQITGKWTTVDDNSGAEKSIIEIYEKDNAFYGRVIKIMIRPGEDPDPVCDKCPADDSRYGKKIIGMEIIKGLKKSDDVYANGTILDPEVGKIYRCKLWVEGNKLQVRGYWGPFFRTQVWKKVL